MIGIVSDVHANLEALEKVFESLDELGVSRVYCLGDIVGYGPNPVECISILRDRKVVSIKGNHERGVLSELPLYWFNDAAREAILWTKSVLSKGELLYLSGLPEFLKEDGFFLVHGSLRDPDGYIISEFDAYKEFYALEESSLKLLFFGHTHVQGAFVLKDGSVDFVREDFSLEDVDMAIVNPGSVGQPRDLDPRAAFLVFDEVKKEIRFFRVEYPLEKTIEKIKSFGLPGWLGERLKKGI